MIATTTAVVASRGLLGSPPVFVVPTFVLESYWECLTSVVYRGPFRQVEDDGS